LLRAPSSFWTCLPTTTGEVDKDAKQEILKDLETRLEAYLLEWRRELDLRGVSKVGIDHAERLPAAIGGQKERAEPLGSTG
jgi:hypothetical protein